MNGVSAVVGDWLRQASLDKYVANFHGVTEEAFLNLLMQDYGKHGVDSTDDKQKLFRLIKRLNAEMKANARQASEWAPPGAEAHARNHHFQDQSPIEGLLDLEEHDGELLMHANSGEDLAPNQARTAQRVGTPSRPLAPALDLDIPDPPKIRVVVRKRPLNRKEIERGDDCIMETDMSRACVIVNETKVKVDLTKYVERHRFNFDDALDESVDNDMVYRATVQPLVHTIFNYGKSTCFAYGQTGSGKTYTMSPLPIRAAADIFQTLQHPDAGELSLWVSCFEIYGGKCYDLLNDRKRLEVREDGRKKICVVGLKEYHVNAASAVQSLIEHSGNARMTGSTGANADSSRSHSIMQFALKRSRQNAEGHREVGRISFIDLAGSERGADTFDNDRQTRIEGAEINKSLLALKECIRALDSDARHVPFRGSKLTEVLRDSFVGSQARTVMIANVSPTASSCEHTLNTLRYADRVKELRKDKADRLPGGVTPAVDAAYNAAAQRGALGPPSKGMGMRQSVSSVTGDANAAAAHSEISPFKEEPAHMLSPEERRPLVQVQEDSQRQLPQQQSAGSRDLLTVRDEMIHSILEGEDELIQMHRKAIEDTMDIVRREMNLLAEVDQPGSAIDSYVEKLGLVLDEKASAIHQLRRRLEAFKAKLLEEETLSRSMTGQRTSR